MFNTTHEISLLTAALPSSGAARVVDEIISAHDACAIVNKARGTLLRDHWWKSWVPPISPTKTLVRMFVPSSKVDDILNSIVERGRLHLQAAGAVYSTPAESTFIGSEFQQSAVVDQAQSQTDTHKLDDNLNVIFCSVGHSYSDKIAKAAINAGAHGPIVYFAEGRGLRDRLGWLRITRDNEQEVLMVLADDADVDIIFDAMAKAGEFHLPARGIMYQMSIDKGMFNLPSRISNHHYAANMQQIINAVDRLSGHTHWRDQSVFDVGGTGKGVGVEFQHPAKPQLVDQVCFSIAVNRSQTQQMMDLVLDAGAPGLNVTYGQFYSKEIKNTLARAQLHKEYAVMRCITDQPTASQIAGVIEQKSSEVGIRDLCVLTHQVPRIAKYIPGEIDHRRTPLHAA